MSEVESEEGELHLENMKEHLFETIKRTFKVSNEQTAQLYSELIQCVKRKHLVKLGR